ncbi:TPA: hypothetical protein N0F65_007425 [Lagenidium giganteum]|uniref:UBC core domain-containing protein n=1 Tax=Lagenidium giganteum TaxID=4803 RepID=A0AAV2ZCS6_9STRA|nr:TPA: hypothetical protein N0F65_007425 [Lagenidium giganteum]
MSAMYMRSDLAALRVRKDVNELSKAKFTCTQVKTKVDFPDGVDNMFQLIFTISIAEVQGPYANGDFTFFVEIPKTYPFHAPVVTCTTRVWHPNVDLETGRVMMPILGQDWRPVLSINTVLLGLQLIFLEPGIQYAMNKQAAELLLSDPIEFRRQVQAILCGGKFYGYEFPAHPRQLEQRRKVWGLQTKRPRDLDNDQLWKSDTNPSSSYMPYGSMSVADNSVTMWKRARHSFRDSSSMAPGGDVTMEMTEQAALDKLRLDAESTLNAVDVLREEIVLFQKTMYKNHSQHRRAPFYQHLQQVKRGVRDISLPDIKDVFVQSGAVLDSMRLGPGVHHIAWKALSSTIKTDVDAVLRRLVAFAEQATKIIDAAQKAYKGLAAQFAMTYFMPFALTMNSMLGRLVMLFKALLVRAIEVHAGVTLLYLNEVTKSNPLRAKVTAVQLTGYQMPARVIEIANI